MVSLTALPDDALNKVLCLLNPEELAHFSGVSRATRELAGDETLWRQHFPTISPPSGLTLKQYVERHAIKTTDQLMKHLEKSLNKARLSKIYEFECFFPLNPGCIIRARLGFGNISSSAIRESKDSFRIPNERRDHRSIEGSEKITWIFTNKLDEPRVGWHQFKRLNVSEDDTTNTELVRAVNNATGREFNALSFTQPPIHRRSLIQDVTVKLPSKETFVIAASIKTLLSAQTSKLEGIRKTYSVTLGVVAIAVTGIALKMLSNTFSS